MPRVIVGEGQPRVLFVNGVYPPQSGATGVLLADLATALVERGWHVRVIAGGGGKVAMPGAGDVDVQVARVLGEPRRGRLWHRTWDSAMLLRRLARAASRSCNVDVVVLASDPPLLFLASGWLRRRTGAPVVHWVQDLYPDVAQALDVRAAGVGLIRQLSTRALRRCDALVAIGRDMADRLKALGVAPERVAVIPNWAPRQVQPGNVETPFRARHGLTGRFVVMYAGTLGLAHPFGAVLDAMEKLALTDSLVTLVVIGQGERREEVEREASRRGLDSVLFLPPVPSTELSNSLGAADLHVVTMDDRLSGLLVPSKVYGALAAGRPVVFVGPADNEAARVIAEAEAGTVVSQATGRSVEAAIRRWMEDSAGRSSAGNRGAQAVAGGEARAADAFDRLLRALSDGGEASGSPRG